MPNSGFIVAGMGGWNYAPWRKTFYPKSVQAADELRYASRQVTAIEINSTFYRLQTPAVFAKWRDSTPDEFVFAVKAPRFITHRKILGEAEASLERFIGSGIDKLGPKLGPIMWQLAPAHSLDPDDIAKFFELLPKNVKGLPLRHAINARHPSFEDSRFVDIARRFNVAIVLEDDAQYPAIADLTSDFVYARLRRSASDCETGYSKKALAKWAERAKEWSQGKQPDGFDYMHSTAAEERPRDVFVFFISGAKERAPLAATALLKMLS